MSSSQFTDKRQRVWLGVLSLTAVLWTLPALMPLQPAWAQSSAPLRTLPDFTDLVEIVGPSVVNIRTLEKAAPSPVAGGPNSGGPSDEELQELFRRFFGMPQANQARLVSQNNPTVPSNSNLKSSHVAWAQALF